MTRTSRVGRSGRGIVVALPLLLIAACQGTSAQRTADAECGPLVICPPARVGHRAIRVSENPTVLHLAQDLDHLERHIDWYGSVVAKVPDIWGQARLSQYREDFESVFKQDLSSFSFGLQGTLARSDAAYFANATALSFAAQPKPPFIGTVNSIKGNAPALVPSERQTTTTVNNPATKDSVVTVAKETAPTPPKAPDPVKPTDLGDPAGLVSGQDTALGQRNAARLPNALAFGQGTNQVGIEPTQLLAQKKRYLDFLAQLRRENEGDDTADSPGYSLNLMRIPVSVLPGKRTDVGFGAEISMTVSPVLGDDLLPMTFRNLIQNDLIHQLGFPLTQVLDGGALKDILTLDVQKLIEGNELIRRWVKTGVVTAADIKTKFNDLSDPDKLRLWKAVKDQVESGDSIPEPSSGENPILVTALTKVLEHYTNLYRREGHVEGVIFSQGPNARSALVPVSHAEPGTTKEAKDQSNFSIKSNSSLNWTKSPAKMATDGKAKQISAAMAIKPLTKVSLSFSTGLDNRTAVPTSQLFDVFGDANLFAIGYGASQALADSVETQGYAHLPDVQSYLREELRAAYQFLAQPENAALWTEFCTEDLVGTIRSKQIARLQDLRDTFRDRLEAITQTDQYRRSRPDNELGQFSKTAALAWCLIVDAALLTDRLVRDMRETATAKGRPPAACPTWGPYFLPNPPAECRQTFNDYVKLRWPIHVFALDPYTQEQNIGDSLSTRREMQLALAIAFTNGQISARNMSKSVRRLEAEYQTVALNRTQVGFSHGENTFGWRFYPRYQTPDTKSNLESFFREQLWGGPSRNALLRDQRLEAGLRECVAIVLMPSFVPYVSVDTSSNWFPLTNPKHKVLDTEKAVKLSQAVQTIKTCATGVTDTSCYRDGEFTRLQRRSEQLEARLPLQTLTTTVPILNTAGGFELFSNGTTDLAPELFGWYGAPGLDPTAETTTLFLVGDHFSPLRTQVIVGNQQPASVKMLSRQVIQVTVHKGAYPTGTETPQVRVHVATPYGVTRELEIPVVKQKPEPKKPTTPAGFSFGGNKLSVTYTLQGLPPENGTAATKFVPQEISVEKPLRLNWESPGSLLTEEVELTFEFKLPNNTTLTVPNPNHEKLRIVGSVQGKVVTIPTEPARQLASAYVTELLKINGGALPIQGNPLAAGVTTAKVTVRQKAVEKTVAQTAETADQFKIEFQAVGSRMPSTLLPPPK